ncbi:MAG: ATP-grasp domain-containing protein [Actinomycetia bacterium]|nr:ATP-grasp domain-containing protein [Actinomycetes bacterium]
MINRLLIANRGEIARRIMRTCRRLGIETVAVFADADADADFVADADLSVPLGGNTPAESYLRAAAIINAARATGADAIHPGYGFLSENAVFAQAVADAGLTFVGPSAEAITAMGSKLEAKARMEAAGVPLLPSATLTGLTGDELAAAGEQVGYPLLVKASAGGGGRGMRIVPTATDLAEAAEGATREAESAFGDGTVYAERYLSPSRHVEVQIFGDDSGRVVHFHERECSIQRRHQKIIEEAPSPSLDDATRSALHQAAVKAGEAIGYTNAGTVEFLLAPPRPDGTLEFFFLEVNTRLQVEHPVTEAILGTDLVELQLSVAAGGEVPEQSAIGPVTGHAMEARIYAEDPTAGFQPSTGPVHRFAVAGHQDGTVRVDTAIESSGEVSQYYDPMIAKVITHAPNRTAASLALARSLASSAVDGITTNRDLLVRILRHPEFLGDQGDSSFLERHDPTELGRSLVEGEALHRFAVAAALSLQETNRSADPHTPSVATGFRNVFTAPQHTTLGVGGHEIEVGYHLRRGRLAMASAGGQALDGLELYGMSRDEVDLAVGGVRQTYAVVHHEGAVSVTSADGNILFATVPRFAEPGDQVEPGSTVATMPGTIVEVRVAEGDTVAAGDVLLVMEAMKMELSITTSMAGTVTAVPISAGDSVEAGAILAVVSTD